MKEYNIGDIISGVVTGVESYGIFLSFGDGCSGLIHISEVSDFYVKNIHDYAKINDILSAQIIDCDFNNHYKLSIKSMHSSFNSLHEKLKNQSDGFSTLSTMLSSWIQESYDEINKKN